MCGVKPSSVLCFNETVKLLRVAFAKIDLIRS